MNNWRVREMRIQSDVDTTRVAVERLWQVNMAGYKASVYRPTPSSLARVMRAIQGQPVFGETCRWRGVLYGAANLKDTSCGKVVDTSTNFGEEYCPYCGKRITVQE